MANFRKKVSSEGVVLTSALKVTSIKDLNQDLGLEFLERGPWHRFLQGF